MERYHPQFRNKLISHQKQIPSLPEEIIEEILLRLPVKSLLKFKCVSRSWCSLIGSKKFVKTHLEISTKNTSFTHHRIITSFLQPNNTIRYCSLRSLLNERITDSFALDCPMNNRDVSVRVVGCCNGLVCILIGGKRFFLWNPSTRMSKKLPDFDELKQGGCITIYGFGYDESSDDYKVFGVLFRYTGQYLTIGKVYSLKTNFWKIIKEDSDGGPFGGEAGKFAGGNLHWVRGREFGLTSGWIIDSFDLKNEVFGMVEQPSYAKDSFYPSLAVLGGCLCVVYDYQKIRLDVWVLKQYEVIESWYKVATVSYLTWEGPLSTPLCIGPEGEIIFECGPNFAIYHPKYNRLWHRQIIGFKMSHEPVFYVESLVSLVAGGE